MADVRLIDANAVSKTLMNLPCGYAKSFAGQAALKEIENAPTVDAVPVVRCKECVLRGSDYCPMCHDEYTYDEDDGGDYYTVDNTDDDGFCHIGKREV
jgi:hypothetical protein